MSDFHLLSIEDDQKLADIICEVAQDAGFVARSTCGSKLPAMYEDFKPDLIVLDIAMPEMDGIEVLQYLHDQYCRAPLLLLSGSDGLSRRIIERMATSLGFRVMANLSKPLRLTAMRQLFLDSKEKLERGHATLTQAAG